MSNSSIEHGIPLTRSSDIVLITNTPKGRGVFAKAIIPAGSIIETCPVLILPPHENKTHIEHTILYHYTYNWPTTNEHGKQITTQAIVFGLGSMFNHSAAQNVGWTRSLERQLVTYTALSDIQVGEELCISYGSRLTFEDLDVAVDADVNSASTRAKTPDGDETDMLTQFNLGDE